MYVYIYQALAVTVITIGHIFIFSYLSIYRSFDPFSDLIPNKQTNYSIRKLKSDRVGGGGVGIDGYPIVCE